MNFIEQVKKGQMGENTGLPTGLKLLDKALNGIQKKAIYCVGASPKVGKTTFVDFSFVLEPFLYFMDYMEKNPDSGLRINWIYFSFEIDRVKKELKYASYFMYKDYGITSFMHKGRMYPMSPNYLEGKLLDDDDKVILLQPDHYAKLKLIYVNRIVPLFGEYSKDGKKIKKGFIDFIEARENPTGLRNYLMQYAKQHGTFVEEKYKTKNDQQQTVEKSRIVGYKENNPKLVTIIVTDHVRKLNRERGFTLKENVDKWIEYQVELRNWCKFTFVDVVHLNRSIGSVERIKYFSESLYPTGDDIKDTGNLSEEADYVITLFNPQDEKYNIKKHFGVELFDSDGQILYPYYRSIHLVESRDTECPNYLQVSMFGNINAFQTLF